jgi:hypothetical protein
MLETDCKLIPCGESNIDSRFKDFSSGNNSFSGCTSWYENKFSFIHYLSLYYSECSLLVPHWSLCEKQTPPIYSRMSCKKLNCYISIEFYSYKSQWKETALLYITTVFKCPLKCSEYNGLVRTKKKFETMR